MNLLPKSIFILYDDRDICKIYWNREKAEEERQRLIEETLANSLWKQGPLARVHLGKRFFVQEYDVEEP